MIVLFNDDYLNRDILLYIEKCRKGQASAQSLYGAMHLEDNGIQVKYLACKRHKPKNRKLLALYDMLQDGHNGFIVPNNNISAFSHKLTGLMMNDELRAVMCKNAIDNSKQFEINKIVGKWMELFQNILKK